MYEHLRTIVPEPESDEGEEAWDGGEVREPSSPTNGAAQGTTGRSDPLSWTSITHDNYFQTSSTLQCLVQSVLHKASSFVHGYKLTPCVPVSSSDGVNGVWVPPDIFERKSIKFWVKVRVPMLAHHPPASFPAGNTHAPSRPLLPHCN